MRLRFAVLGAAGLVALVPFAPVVGQNPPPPVPAPDPLLAPPGAIPPSVDFGKKVLIVTVVSPGGLVPQIQLLESARTRQLGLHTFLVGKPAREDDVLDPDEATTIWLPVTGITQIVEYETLDAAKEVFERFRRKR